MKKMLVASRGEIALRIIQSAAEMGIKTAALFVQGEEDTLDYADEAYLLPGKTPEETFLNSGKIIQIAKDCGADALHPGYGFLSENASFALEVQKADICFVGPTVENILNLGNKMTARKIAEDAGIPTLPGWKGKDFSKVKKWAKTVGYPLMIKAALGGGGRGLRIVEQEKDLDRALEAAAREAESSFGDSTLFVEKYLVRPRHIEVQILGDSQGHLIHLGERECSLQRRHQKILEESPSPSISMELRKKIGEAALTIGRQASYVNAGTVEFIVDAQERFYFLEVNTRLQVEHPITEMVTGLDLVKAQIEIAEGKPLALSQEQVSFRGHAIEARIYAEDPGNDFLPSAGSIGVLREPRLPSLRIDSSLKEGQVISSYFDPMLSKVIAHGFCREEALKKLSFALSRYVLLGLPHNIDFLGDLLKTSEVQQGNYHTQFVESYLKTWSKEELPKELESLFKEKGARKVVAKKGMKDFSPAEYLQDFRNA